MANDRKKSYKKDTVNSEKTKSLLDDMHTKYDNDELLEEILMETLDSDRKFEDPYDLDVILGLKPAPEQKPVEQKPVEQKPAAEKQEKKTPEKQSEEKTFAEKPEKKAKTAAVMPVVTAAAEKAAKSKKPKQAPQKPVEQKPVEQKPVEQKTVEQKSAEPKSEEQKPVEQKPVEQKPVEQKSAEPKSEEQKPVEQKPVDHAEKKEPEKPAAVEKKQEKAKDSGTADGKKEDKYVPANLAELVEFSEEDRKVNAEISAAVSAAIAEKAEKHKAAEKADTGSAPAKKKKSAKKKEPEIKPLKPLLNIANIVYTAVAFAAVTAAFIALPRESVSETEQRKLAEFPEFNTEEFLNGKYTNGITNYFNDNVPYRDDLKKVAAQLRSFYGISYNDAEIIGPVAVVTTEEEPEPDIEETEEATTTTAAPVTENTTGRTTAPVTTTTEETTTTPATTTQPVETTKNVNEIAAGVVTNGQVVTKLSDGHWWGISLYGGGNGKTYAKALNRFKKELGDSVNVWSMPAPTSGEFYLPDSYSQYNASHAKSIETINSQLKDVTPVDCVTELWKHVDEDIYLRTDHHWQPLGAYYAAKAFVEAAGLPFADKSTMERVDIPGYMGTMYGFTESANLLSDPEVFTYYKPTNKYYAYYYDTKYNYTGQFAFFIPMPVNGSYSTFMGADNKIVRIKTDAGTGRKLVIFKDSYGNAEIPFYFNSFDEIWVCDMRYFELNGIEFVKFTGATDLLFTCCTFSAVGANANGLDTILNNPVTTITEGAGQ